MGYMPHSSRKNMKYTLCAVILDWESHFCGTRIGGAVCTREVKCVPRGLQDIKQFHSPGDIWHHQFHPPPSFLMCFVYFVWHHYKQPVLLIFSWWNKNIGCMHGNTKTKPLFKFDFCTKCDCKQATDLDGRRLHVASLIINSTVCGIQGHAFKCWCQHLWGLRNEHSCTDVGTVDYTV